MRIEGYFNENDEPVIKINLGSTSIEVLIDTGFAGSLIIPQELSTDLTLNFEGFEEFYTVTGHVFVAPAYSVEANWFGERIKVPLRLARTLRKHCSEVRGSKTVASQSTMTIAPFRS